MGTETDHSLHRKRALLIHAFFLLSGASALVYEIVWTRQLIIVTGATTPAVSLVLAIFMGGLALGAWAFGRVADRSARLLRWYGALELSIGLFALAQPWLLSRLGHLYLRFLPGTPQHGLWLLGLRVLLAGLLILLPTMLMGGTFPILVRFVADRDGRVGRAFGALYAVNLLGAVLGSALTGFLLIPALGVRGTLHWALATNLAVGLLALLIPDERGPHDALDAPAAPAPDQAPGLPASPALRRVLWCTVAGSGFLTMGYEVAWTRMLVFSFSSTIYTFTLILVVFLLGLSLGSFIFTRLERRPDGARSLSLCQFLSSGSSLVLATLVGHFQGWQVAASRWLGYSGGVHLGLTLFGSAVVMLVPVVLMGVVFPLSSRMLMTEPGAAGRRIGSVYWVNTIGSILGSLVIGFAFIPILSVKGCLLALAGIQALLAFLLLPWGGFPGRMVWRLGAGGALIVALAGGLYMNRLPGPNPFDNPDSNLGVVTQVEAHRDDPAGSVTVVRTSTGNRLIRINGFMATTDASQAAYMPMMSHLPILLHGHAHKVLVICVGTGSTAGAALLHPGVQVDAVDINATVLKFTPLFAHVNHGLNQDPRARLINDDGRNFLLSSRHTYDVITSEPMPPTHAGVVNLYTQEYYTLVKEHLNPGGMLVQWLPIHLVHPEEARSILRSVQNVFPETTLWFHAATGLIVARKDSPIRMDVPGLKQAFQEKALLADLQRLGVPTVGEFIQLYALGPEGVRQLVGNAPPVTDDNPFLEFHTPRSVIVPMVGGLQPVDSWVTAQLAYTLRAHEEAPLSGVTPQEDASVQATMKIRTEYVLGDLWMEANRSTEAEQHFARGLSLATTPSQRGDFLYRLAQSAVARGDAADADQFLTQCLQATPGNRAALELRKLVPPQHR